MLLRRSLPSPAGSSFTRFVAAGALVLASVLAATLLTPNAASAAPQAAEVAPSTSAWFLGDSVRSGADPSGVVPTLPLVTVPPIVTGVHAVGQKLTVTALWEPTPIVFSYQWKRDGSAISKATAATYALVKADAGRSISVTVTGVKSGFATARKTSSSVRIQKLLTATPIPTITGHAVPGSLLTAHAGTWKPSPVTAHYAWMINGVLVSTKSKYRVLSQDAGKSIAIWVTGSRSGYTPVTRMSLSRQVPGGSVSS